MKKFRNILIATPIILMLINIYLIFMVAPTDVNLGHIQRIFYLHVPTALLSFVAFFTVAGLSVSYLINKNRAIDRLSQALAEVGLVFVTLALVTGSIWAKPVWGVWWTWEPRLTTTLILWFIYVAYVMVRSYTLDSGRASKFAAVLGIVGGINVPIVNYSVMLRSIHPGPVIGDESKLPNSMLLVLVFSLIAFGAVLLALVKERHFTLYADHILSDHALKRQQKSIS